MSKYEIMDHIRRLNPSAHDEFLAEFSEDELLAYLHQLEEIKREQLCRKSPDAVLVGQA